MMELEKEWPPVLSALLFFGATLLLVELIYLGLFMLEMSPPLSFAAEQVRYFVGPVWPALAAMILLAFSASLALLANWLGLVSLSGILSHRILSYITEAAPQVGLLGTFLALMRLQFFLDGEMEQARLLSTLAREGGQAYGSTVVGITVALFSFTVSRLLGGEE